jgi:hypothetical protein
MATKSKPTELEIEPDAWSRFERAIDVVAKSPPTPLKDIPKKNGESRAKAPKKRRKNKAV